VHDLLGRDVAALVSRVYAYVAYRIGPGPDAEDITSETFERALRYRDSFDRGRGGPEAWLIGIAQRVIAGAHLAQRIPDEGPLGDNPDHADAADVRLDLARAMGRLEERDRELIALRYGGDLTARQIAEIVGMKANAVEVALHRALARMRRELAADEGGASPQGDATVHATADPVTP
jgi:RNA polymerase sigma-70 factor (ECF subfamily)